jgi:hypothetical protein
MTQQERNKQIALMLGWTYNSFNDRWNEDMHHDYSFLKMDELKFHSDWNWLMDAVEFAVEHFEGTSSISERILDMSINSPKEDVFVAVSEFAEYYNTKNILKKSILKYIDIMVKDCLLYKMDNEVWLIKPNKKEWVVTIRGKYLWFNYDIFDDVFKFFDLDVIKYKIIIKHWVEDRLRIKIGPNYEANKIRGGYDWSGDFDVKKVITTGKIITPTITP